MLHGTTTLIKPLLCTIDYCCTIIAAYYVNLCTTVHYVYYVCHPAYGIFNMHSRTQEQSLRRLYVSYVMITSPFYVCYATLRFYGTRHVPTSSYSGLELFRLVRTSTGVRDLATPWMQHLCLVLNYAYSFTTGSNYLCMEATVAWPYLPMKDSPATHTCATNLHAIRHTIQYGAWTALLYIFVPDKAVPLFVC